MWQAKSGDLIFINSDGLSMRPLLRPKDKLIVERVPLEDLKIGDIILYREADKQIICHRLIKKALRDNNYILFAKGDASFNLEGPIIEENFIGKVVGLIRKEGKIIDLTGFWQRVLSSFIIICSPLATLGIKAVSFGKMKWKSLNQ